VTPLIGELLRPGGLVRRNPKHRQSTNEPYGSLVKVIGIEACRALFHSRPNTMRRVLIMKEAAEHFRDLAAFCRDKRIPYRLASVEEISRLTETPRHDGICIMARKKALGRPESLIAYVDRTRGPLLLPLVEELKNPNNVGAMLRVCGFFGSPFLLAAGETVGLSMATMRTAQGAAESVDLVRIGDGPLMLSELKKRGLRIIGTSSHAERTVGQKEMPARAVLMFGGENRGLSERLAKLADFCVAIPGAGTVESLNIACAASVILWEHWRAWRVKDAHPAPPSTSTPRS
jgi:RNA methyltransferase, TrmH family